MKHFSNSEFLDYCEAVEELHDDEAREAIAACEAAGDAATSFLRMVAALGRVHLRSRASGAAGLTAPASSGGAPAVAKILQKEPVSNPVPISGKSLKKQGHSPEEADRLSISGQPPVAEVLAAEKLARASRAVKTGDRMAALLARFKSDYVDGYLLADGGSAECKIGGRVERGIMQRATLLLRGALLEQGRSQRGGQDYRMGLNFHQPGEVEAVAFIQSGARDGRSTPRLTVKGGHGFCSTFAPILQKAEPDFGLIRADACLDLLDAGPGAFEALHGFSEDFARARRLALPCIVGDETAGRTSYLDGPGGVRLRVYEKGKKEQGAGSLTAPPGWIRIEFEFKVKAGPKRLSTARLTPGELVCNKTFSRRWLEGAAAMLDLVDAGERAARFVADYQPKIRKVEDSMMHGGRQFGRTYARGATLQILEEYGGDHAAAVEAGEFEREAFDKRCGQLFVKHANPAIDKFFAETRVDRDESDEEWSAAVAAGQQARALLDMDRDAEAAAAQAVALAEIDGEAFVDPVESPAAVIEADEVEALALHDLDRSREELVLRLEQVKELEAMVIAREAAASAAARAAAVARVAARREIAPVSGWGRVTLADRVIAALATAGEARAARDAEAAKLPPRVRAEKGRFASALPAVARWKPADRQFGERLFDALRAALFDLKASGSAVHLAAAMDLRPKGLIRDGLSVGEAVMDPSMHDHLLKIAPALAARIKDDPALTLRVVEAERLMQASGGASGHRLSLADWAVIEPDVDACHADAARCRAAGEVVEY